MALFVQCKSSTNQDLEQATNAARNWLDSLSVADTSLTSHIFRADSLTLRRDEVLLDPTQIRAFRQHMSDAKAILISPESAQVVLVDNEDESVARRMVLTVIKQDIRWRVVSANEATPIR